GRAEAMQSPGGFYCDDPGPVLAIDHSGGIRSFVLVSEGTVDWTSFGIRMTTSSDPRTIGASGLICRIIAVTRAT
ncbi:hypothetical protein ACC809_36325, partial [Rhizobium johnstonii]